MLTGRAGTARAATAPAATDPAELETVRYTIVDVFAEARYEGNALAVVQDAGSLDTATMQAIAREMNLSETTFVVAQAKGRAVVRIFTPVEELPFAGHPTLGTAWVLARGGRPVTLELAAGDVAVRFAEGVAWMTPPPAAVGKAVAADVAAALVGLEPRDLDVSLGPCIVSCGPSYMLIGVRTLEALARVEVGLDALRRPVSGTFPYCVCRGGRAADADYAARMHFFDGVGVREDPATGSAAAAFAGYLRKQGVTGDFVLEQGFEIARPSRLYLRVGEVNEIGGRVYAVAEGRLV